MNSLPSDRPTSPAPKDWPRLLMAYTNPDNGRALSELVMTAVPFVLLWAAAAMAVSINYWLTLAICVPAAGFLTRLFIFQHDCGHRACFESRRANDFLGRVIGVLTLTPYAMWRRSHAQHHSISGNLDRRRDSDIRTLTVQEYQGLSPLARLGYRAYRNPFTLFIIGPFWVFFIRYRLPIDLKSAVRSDWFSTMGTNLAILLAVLGLGYFIGLRTVLLVHVPIGILTATIGVWLFYVQHQFEQTSWDHDQEWNLQAAALYGSSYYDLPELANWFTGNIGMHHVHHLSSRIPFYRLPEVLADYPVLASTSHISLRDSLHCVRLHLWDEDQHRLVSFAQASAITG